MPNSTTYVFTIRPGKGGCWSRYIFPFVIDNFAQLGNDLYVRHGDSVSIVDEDSVSDYTEDGALTFEGLVQWPWLDFGQPGVTKMLRGFDVVGSGVPSVSVGYDQRNVAAYTTPYRIPADTVPGGIIPMPVSAPSVSMKVEFEGGTKWNLQAVMVYLQNKRVGAAI